MPFPRRRKAPELGLLALVALAATMFSVAAGGGGAAPSAVGPAASDWRGLVGGPRPAVAVGQRMIVLLKTPSLAERVAAVGGRASENQQRRWTVTTLAAQSQLLASLESKGIRLRPDYRYARVLSGFSAALDGRTVALLEHSREVRAVYPVRVAYPASVRLTRDAAAAGSAYRPEVGLPGFDGRGVRVALLDTGVDLDHPFLRGRVSGGADVLDGDASPAAEPKPGSSESERHGTQLAGVVAGAGGPNGLAGVAPRAELLPIRVAGWQRDAGGGWAVYSRTDQLIAGLERAVDPNRDGSALDGARIALVGLAEPYAAFAEGPAARAVAGAVNLGTLVVAPAGNDGPAGPRFGSISGPGGAPAALTVGAADLRGRTQAVRVVARAGLDVALNRVLPLAGAVAPARPLTLEVAAPARAAERTGLVRQVSDPVLVDAGGFSVVAGRAALIPAGNEPAAAALGAARAGAAAVLLYGARVPGGGLGLDDEVDVPVVGIPQSAAGKIVSAVRAGASATVTIGPARTGPNLDGGGMAVFSSRGLAFDGRVKPDVTAPGVSLHTAEPGLNDNGLRRYGALSGSSAAAAVVAGAAAILAQARPELDAASLKSLLVGSARPLPRESAAAQGAGLIDLGAAAVAELAATPATLAFRTVSGAGWQVTQTLLLRNVSSRPLPVTITHNPDERIVLASSPRRVLLTPGRSVRVWITARLAYAAMSSAPIEGALELRPQGGVPVRVPWIVTFRPRKVDLLGSVRLSATSFAPSDVTPAVLAFQAGKVLASEAGRQVQPVARLDLELWARGRKLGLLARLRDLLPGSYAFGLTGRGPAGDELEPGRYRLLLRAVPPGGGRASERSVKFRIR